MPPLTVAIQSELYLAYLATIAAFSAASCSSDGPKGSGIKPFAAAKDHSIPLPSCKIPDPMPPTKDPTNEIAAVLIISLTKIGSLRASLPSDIAILPNTPKIPPNKLAFFSTGLPSASNLTSASLSGPISDIIASGIPDRKSVNLSGNVFTKSSIPVNTPSTVSDIESIASSPPSPPNAFTKPIPPPSKPPIKVPPGIGNNAPIIAPVEA